MTSKVLMNRYHLQEKIGYGGMGQVYLGWDSILKRAVAIKMMPNYDEQIKERYRREAASLASLNHPNIIKIYDVGEEAGASFLVMEYVPGPTLQEIIKTKAPLELNEGLRIIQKVLGGLGEVHGKGIIHRDLKPQNILVTMDGQVKLCDFGIAKVGTLETLTVTGMALGTVQYMAPEQLMGGEVSPASDIYSLGVILYEMFTGFLPFNGRNIGEIAQKHFNLNPTPICNLNLKIDKNLSLLVAKCLAKTPRERFQGVADLQFLIAGKLTIQYPEILNLRDYQIEKKLQIKKIFQIKKICKSYLYKLLNKIPLKKMIYLAFLGYALTFGMNNLGPWLETKSEEYFKHLMISELQRKVPYNITNKKKKNIKNEVQKVKTSLQKLQKDAQLGNQKVINDNLEQWRNKILTHKEILRKLEEKLNQEYSKISKTIKGKKPKENMIINK